jgi:hypothetical protein
MRDLFLRFHPEAAAEAERVAAGVPDRSLSPAQIQQDLLMHPDPRQAADAILAQSAAQAGR